MNNFFLKAAVLIAAACLALAGLTGCNTEADDDPIPPTHRIEYSVGAGTLVITGAGLASDPQDGDSFTLSYGGKTLTGTIAVSTGSNSIIFKKGTTTAFVIANKNSPIINENITFDDGTSAQVNATVEPKNPVAVPPVSGDTYSIHGSGLTQAEWNSNGLGAIDPSQLINQSFNDTVVAQFIAALAADDYGVHGYSQSEAQLRTSLAGYGNDVNTIISKLKTQGWVFYATRNTVDPNEYADIIGIIKEQ
jgi:hypothetical protein